MDSIAWGALLICLLTLGTLYFSVSVVSLRTFSRVRLQEAFKSKGKESTAEALTDRIAEKAEELICVGAFWCLVLNGFILLTLLEVIVKLHPGQPGMGDYVIVLVIAMLIFLVFDLAIPQAWGKYAGEAFLSRTHVFLMFSMRAAFPVLYAHRIFDGLIRRLAGVAETTPQQQHEERQEEFLDGLEQQRIEGVVDEEEQEMIENVLELSETTVGEIMTPRTDITALEVNATLEEVLATINRAGHTRVPVYENTIDTIIGLIYAKDLLAEAGKPAAVFRLRDKIREAYFVPETKPLRVLLHEFQHQKLHIAVVLDEYGGTAGIVTLEDIIEELVGEIFDEYEKASSRLIKRIDEHTIEADARTYIDDLNDEFEFSLPEDEDYDTVGGFVFSHLGYIPKTGEAFDYGKLRFTITAAEARKIRRIRIQKVPESQN